MASKVWRCVYISGLLVLFVCCLRVFGAGTTSANFLKIIPGARAAALGGAYTALADDASAIYWNPAALSCVSSKDVDISYNLWLQDIQNSFVAFALPIANKYPETDHFVAGMSVNYLSIGGLERRSGNTSSSEGAFGAYDGAVSIGASRRAFSIYDAPLYAGACVTFIRENIDSYNAGGFAASAGLDCLTSMFDTPFRAAVAVRNIGSPITFINESDPLPLVTDIGFSAQPLHARNIPLNVACDIAFPNDDTLNWGLGAEYTVGKLIALRAGYNQGDSATRRALSSGSAGYINGSGLAQATGFSAGFGLILPMNKYFHSNAFDILRIDYAFVPYGDLGNTHRISLGIKW